MNINVVPFENKYQKQTVNLILSIQRNEFNFQVESKDRADLLDIETHYLGNGSGNFWLALYNDNVIGTISIVDIGNKQLALQNMYVHKDFRGIKYDSASKLLRETIHFADKKNKDIIYLGTAADFFAAHKFYERKGFAQIGKETLPSKFPIMSVDSVFYELIL